MRPLALAPAGDRLFAVNTPDGRLEVLDVAGGRPELVRSIPVGLEPVAVAARSDEEVWVVNHLSDSVSVVDVPSGRVVRTLLVGDEPRDIVFAGGAGNRRAFVTTAHRGQHRNDPSIASVPGAGDAELATPSVPRADVWVFDAGNQGSAFGGVPIAILELFGDTPRALAVSPDRERVYAAVFQSGNRTTTVGEPTICDGFQPDQPCLAVAGPMPGGNPGPATNHAGVPAPEVGLIVKQDPVTRKWQDELGRDWSGGVRFDLPDLDVFEIAADFVPVAAAAPPSGGALLAPPARPAGPESRSFSGVGTVLFNMVVNPRTGRLYVSNSEARNEVRFEGTGAFVRETRAKRAGEPETVQGRLHEMRITVIDPGSGAVVPRHLNEHLVNPVTGGYHRPVRPDAAEKSLAIPLDMAISSDGSTLYVAAFGSSAIGVVDTAALESGAFDPETASDRYIRLTGGGPSGLVLDEPRDRLYVLTRFDNTVRAIDLGSRREVGAVPLHDREPEAVRAGRPVLYDARHTSSNGEASCASCHVFGDLDNLAWDLGDPDGDLMANPMPINLEEGGFLPIFQQTINGTGSTRDLSAMKGPMTTQTLRGMVNGGSMHWRGDRSGGTERSDVRCMDDPSAPHCDSAAAFDAFLVAFEGLLGRREALPEEDMERFRDFALEITLPPNPVRALDNRLSPSEQRGFDFFTSERLSDGVPGPGTGFPCHGCHTLRPSDGFFGTDGTASFESETQIVKIPHLRNLYTKVGMFGLPPTLLINPGDHRHVGDQIRGFGFLHDGAIDTLFRFFSATVFSGTVAAGFNGGDPERRDMERFMLAFDSDLAPVVGQQVTLGPSSGEDADRRLSLLLEMARTPFESAVLERANGGPVSQCDVVAKGTIDGEMRGWSYRAVPGDFRADDGSVVSARALRALAEEAGQEITYTCVPPGSGERIGIDRDGDGVLDRFD